MYKACIFDLDGTLTDTLESLTFSVNETLKEVALPAITEEQCRTFVGNGAKVLIEQSLKAAGDTKLLLFEKAFEAYGRIFDRNCTYHVKPYPGRDALKAERSKHEIRSVVEQTGSSGSSCCGRNIRERDV